MPASTVATPHRRTLKSTLALSRWLVDRGSGGERTTHESNYKHHVRGQHALQDNRRYPREHVASLVHWSQKNLAPCQMSIKHVSYALCEAVPGHQGVANQFPRSTTAGKPDQTDASMFQHRDIELLPCQCPRKNPNNTNNLGVVPGRLLHEVAGSFLAAYHAGTTLIFVKHVGHELVKRTSDGSS